MFGFMGGYLPNASMQQMPMYQPQMQPSRQQMVGRWLTARNFTEVQQAAIPADGSQTIFMLENEPVFYLVSLQNGQKMVQGYRFEVLQGTQSLAEPPKVEQVSNTTSNFEERISKLERFSERMQILIGDETDGKSAASNAGAESK